MDSIFYGDDASHDHGGCCANRERAEKARQAKLRADLEAANAQLHVPGQDGQAFTTRLTIHTAVEKSLRSPDGTGLSRPEGDFHQSSPSDEADDGATSLTAERLVSLKVPLVNFSRVARMTVGGENGGKPVLVCLSPCTGSEEPQNQPWIKVFRHAAADIASKVCSAACIVCLPNNPTATCGDSECPWRLDLPSNTPQEERAKFNFATQCLLPMMMFGTDPVVVAWRGNGISGMICGKEKLSDPAAVNPETLSNITGISNTPDV
ncbi:hypothetical protein Pmar_PMAR015318 [Perkinsus marinus ATCC 50983]|uniref:Uncharacterized protein n=1 Tax=Perkinsus marinus (strain ATCC 50983 / TXsc) TaxID=423536 RepID=C5KLA0_PERM5|nr:hypothetical protein Pmar_PMAR015318 [Perkinsus marinus ATCC 50983]EER14773.1 hypothetical protein Pmar_PMAR015318 [Perkinsus marinus ATCC 50983]|eukprot:XP_002782977.1 hypothetical protein Pmar_PMAR015318 [Perkinsus marinus ATCC 50983]